MPGALQTLVPRWPAVTHATSCTAMMRPTDSSPSRPIILHQQVIYYIVMAVFGALKGLLQLNLGAVTTFQARAWAGLTAARRACRCEHW